MMFDDLAGNVVTLTQAQVEALSATVVGTDGADTISMSQGIAATVHGGAGDDTINGTWAADKLYGEDGNDTILGYGGADLLDGGAGDDTITGRGAFGETAIGGAGDDVDGPGRRTGAAPMAGANADGVLDVRRHHLHRFLYRTIDDDADGAAHPRHHRRA